MSGKLNPHSDADIKYIAAQPELHHQHTPLSYTMVSRKPYPPTWVFNKSLLRLCFTIHTHTGALWKRHSDVVKIMTPASAADCNVHILFWGEWQKHRILPLTSLNWGLISVAVIKWHRLLFSVPSLYVVGISHDRCPCLIVLKYRVHKCRHPYFKFQ